VKLGVLAAFVLALVCGCECDQETAAMADAYYLNPYKDLHKLGRVAIIELDNTSAYPEISAEMTEALLLELQKAQVFGVMVVRRDDPAWRNLQENLDSLQALRRLAAVRKALNCGGLLVGTVTRYQPYPHMLLSLRLKLLDLADGQLLWGVEQVWDGADKSIQKRVQTYLKHQRRSGHTPLREELVVVSSLNFCQFVAYEVAQTLERDRSR
jgi:hypothetical protein